MIFGLLQIWVFYFFEFFRGEIFVPKNRVHETELVPVLNLFSEYSNLPDTEDPKIPTFQGSKNSDTVLG